MILPTISIRIERWKFNKDFGVYVSTLGNFKDRHKRRLPIKIGDKGYCYVKVEGPQPFKLAHRLVMLTWRPIPNVEELTVDHLNHNKRDNSLNNLEWVTREENTRRAKEDLIPKKPKKISIFSPKCPLHKYQEMLVGFKLNEIFCHDQEAVLQALEKLHPNGDYRRVVKAEMMKMITRQNMSGVKKIYKGLQLSAVYKEVTI